MPVIIGKDEKLKKQKTCSSCGSINEYWPNEVIELWRGTDYGGGPDGADGFKCAASKDHKMIFGYCGANVITKRW